MQKPIPHDTERFRYYTNGGRPVIPPGYTAPLDMRTTRERIREKIHKLSQMTTE